jgi:hypothetical protein
MNIEKFERELDAAIERGEITESEARTEWKTGMSRLEYETKRENDLFFYGHE